MKPTNRLVPLGWILGLALLAGSAAGAGWVLHNPGSSSTPEQLPAPAPSAARNIDQMVVCFGLVDVEPGITQLSPSQAGEIVELPVKESESVKAGQPLLRIDDRIARLQLEAAKADAQAAQELLTQARKLPEQHQAKREQELAKIRSMQEQLTGARAALNAAKDLLAKNLIKEAEVTAKDALVKQLEQGIEGEKAVLRELDLADPDSGIRTAELNLAAKQSKVQQAERLIEMHTLVAPSDGKILRVLTRVGEVFGPQSRQPAILFCPDLPRIVRAEIDEEWVSRVAIGCSVSVQDYTNSQHTWRGKIVRLADSFMPRRSLTQEPFQFNDVRTLECIVQLEPGQPLMRLNQRVRVTINPHAAH